MKPHTRLRHSGYPDNPDPFIAEGLSSDDSESDNNARLAPLPGRGPGRGRLENGKAFREALKGKLFRAQERRRDRRAARRHRDRLN
jgi:hypothetical protein